MTDPVENFDKDKRVIRKRKDAGVDAYGLYVTILVADETPEKKLEREERFFLVDDLLCYYTRQNGFKRAAWKVEKCEDHDSARKQLLLKIAEMPQGRSVMPVAPLVMELAGSDIESIKLGEPPAARFLGTTSVERMLIDPIDDATWVYPGK